MYRDTLLLRHLDTLRFLLLFYFFIEIVIVESL